MRYPKKGLKSSINMDKLINKIRDNPNLYGWIPKNKKADIDIEDINIQDIPPPAVPDNYSDVITMIAEEVDKNKQRELLRRIRKNVDDTTLVSVDDPKKYEIVRKFIKTRGLKVYGGIAINSYLPEKDKIYSKEDIPDYDFFSPDPWNDAVRLANIFYRKGYKYSEARAGTHKGTYKVFVNFWPVADITYMPKLEFDRLKTNLIDGVNVICIEKVFEALYKEFTEPFGNAPRWPKIAEREKLLETNVELIKNMKCTINVFKPVKLPEKIKKLLDVIYKYGKTNKLIFTGDVAYNDFIQEGRGNKFLPITNIAMLSLDAQKDIDSLFSELIKIYKNLNTTSHFYPSRDKNSHIYRIFADFSGKEYLLTEISQLTLCTPYQKIDKNIICTIDYLKYELFYMSVFGTSKEQEVARCKIKYLSNIQYAYYRDNNLKETDISPFQRFSYKCKGPIKHPVKIAVLEKALEKMARDKEMIVEESDGFIIKKYPKKVDKCLNLSKKNCSYPCNWNRDKCGHIPEKGIFLFNK